MLKNARKLTLIALPVLGAVAALLAAGRLRRIEGEPIPCRGGREFSARIEAPFYSQTDPRWADAEVGGSLEKIRNVGCTLTCLCMALACAGHSYDPGTLNDELKARDGYTDRGWIIWSAVSEITDGSVEIVASNAPEFDTIDACIEKGTPVIAQIPDEDGNSHWVLIVGKDGAGYLGHDPLGQTGGYEQLSGRGMHIARIRYAKAVEYRR